MRWRADSIVDVPLEELSTFAYTGGRDMIRISCVWLFTVAARRSIVLLIVIVDK